METNSAMSLEPLIARINTDEDGLAGTLGAQSGRVLHRLLQASLQRPFQSPSSICFANDQVRPNTFL